MTAKRLLFTVSLVLGLFVAGGFASGLVIYWITNNTITFTQQYMIMRSHGHKPDLFGNIKSGFSKKKPVEVAKK